MLLDILLVQLALCVAQSHAFYPWIPEYVCEEHGNCNSQGSRRDVGGSGTVTFPLSRVTRDTSESDPDRLSRTVRYLSAKYGRAFSAGESGQQSSTRPAKRQTNNYTVSKAATPTFQNSVPLHQDGADFSYFIEVGLGASPKTMLMLLDTGAGTTWIMGSSCKTSACRLHSLYGPEDSTTYMPNSKTFSITYGSGSVAGTIATDSLSIAGKRITMSFGVANTTSEDFNHFPFDGILGLSMNTGSTDNLLQTLKKEKTFSKSVVGVYVSRSSDGPNEGEVTFGGINPAKYIGTIGYTTVQESTGGAWAIPIDDVIYDGKKAGIANRMAYIDTGTSYMFGPPDDVAALHKQIPGAVSADGVTFTAPCGSDRPLTVVFSGISYTILARDWLSTPQADGTCVSNIYGNEPVKGAWLLGDVFLKNVYAVFDMDQTRIGFAPRPAPPPLPTTTSAAPSRTPGPSSGLTTTTGGGVVATPAAATSAGVAVRAGAWVGASVFAGLLFAAA